MPPQNDSLLGMLSNYLGGQWSERERETGRPMGMQNVAALTALEFLKPPPQTIPTQNPRLLETGITKEPNPEWLEMFALGTMARPKGPKKWSRTEGKVYKNRTDAHTDIYGPQRISIREQSALKALDEKKNILRDKKTGKRFWGFVVDLRDGFIEYKIPYSKAFQVNFHHNSYMPKYLAKKIDDAEAVLMFPDKKGDIWSLKWPSSVIKYSSKESGYVAKMQSEIFDYDFLSPRIKEKILQHIDITPPGKK